MDFDPQGERWEAILGTARIFSRGRFLNVACPPQFFCAPPLIKQKLNTGHIKWYHFRFSVTKSGGWQQNYNFFVKILKSFIFTNKISKNIHTYFRDPVILSHSFPSSCYIWKLYIKTLRGRREELVDTFKIFIILPFTPHFPKYFKFVKIVGCLQTV